MNGWEILGQDEIWINSVGREIQLEDMNDSYLVNLKGWLLRHAETYQHQQLNAMYLACQHLNGEMALDMIEAEMDSLGRQNALLWMERQPLYLAISRHIDKRREAAPEKA
jgi:hypothetical protein